MLIQGRDLWFAVLLMGVPGEAALGQSGAVPCEAAICEAGAIYAAAIDSVRWHLADTTLPPRVLRSVYLGPFRQLGVERGASVAQVDGQMLRRALPVATIVDSAQVVLKDGTLRAGGSLYIVSPLDWVGEDAARLEVARYLTWTFGEQYFVWVRREGQRWRVTRLETGWQN